jgi:hypothetical protein
MPRPLANRIPSWQRPPTLGKGMAHRTLDARPLEDRQEAIERAKRDTSWGDRIVAIARTGPSTWTVSVKELPAERLVRLKALQDRRDAR